MEQLWDYAVEYREPHTGGFEIWDDAKHVTTNTIKASKSSCRETDILSTASNARSTRWLPFATTAAAESWDTEWK